MVSPTEASPSVLAREREGRPAWHALGADEALARLGVEGDRGLTETEVADRLRSHGPNRLIEERQVTFLKVLREEVTEPMILLLLAVGVVYALWGELRDAVAIFLIISGITLIEVYNEHRAKAAIASLRRLAAPTAPVVRGGRPCHMATEDLVPGDLVLLSPGERVPADLRLLEAVGLRIEESSLTGESEPASKVVDAVESEAELGDRRSMAYTGTLVTSGRGRGVVVATGMATELGRIAGLVKAAREPRTPLQLAMRQLSGFLVWIALGFSVLVPLLGLAFGQPLREMVLTGLSLAFATIPEEMPILITIVLGLGGLRLARRHAIVKRLRAAETLGSVSVIATDKTGTLTENRMAVREVWLPGGRSGLTTQEAARDHGGRELLELGVLANDATRASAGGQVEFAGDPTDVALLAAGSAAGLDLPSLRGAGPIDERTFEEHRRLMSAAYRRGDHVLVAAKGAPEAILARCDRESAAGVERPLDEQGRATALQQAEALAGRGLRTLALAYRRLSPDLRRIDGDGATGGSSGYPEDGLVFAGFVGLADPPRPEVPRALAELRAARIRVLMLTGDHPATARSIAKEVGIDGGRVLVGRELGALSDDELAEAVREVSVFARIAPEHKLRIVRALQANGEVVAVTGDGVNDAPALREAAIGVAMGETGTDVAKEAAGMILGDDDFATLGVAVREGRLLFENLRKAVRYYLAAKVALVLASLIAVLAQLPVPFAPVQIILMELFMDLGASVTFTTEPAEGDLMARPPHDPRRPFVDRALGLGVFAGGFSLGLAVVAAYVWASFRGGSSAHAQTVAFATWMVGHVLLAVHMRTERQPILGGTAKTSPAMLLWGLAAVATAAAVVGVPILTEALKAAPLSAEDWLVAVAAPLIATSGWEVWKRARGARQGA